jgi:peroxiredoxin
MSSPLGCSLSAGYRRVRLGIVPAVLLSLAFGCAESIPPGLEPGKPAPDIIGEGIDASPIALSQFSGKVVLIDFWATWCPPCRAEIPGEKELHEKYAGRPFTILGVSRDRTRDDLVSFATKEKLPWPIVFDATGNIFDQWKIASIPTYALIDHHGVILRRWSRSGQMPEIEKEIEKAVREAEKK